MKSHPLFRLLTIVLLVAAAVELSGCVTGTSLVTGRKRAYGYTWEQEVALGKEADASVISQYGLYDDPDLAHYVDSLGQALLATSHARRPDTPQEVRQTPFTFRLLDSPVVNAFALPGGYIYVTRGLMAHLENEAQLAVVLGHEIGHVVGRHASIRAANQTFGQALLIGGAVGGQVLLGGDAGSTILQGGSTVAQLAFLSYGRDDERESDDLGVEYASLQGYEADQAAEFFRSLKRMSESSGQQIPSFLSTHPDPGEREQTIHRLASEWAQTTPTSKIGRRQLLARVDGIVAGENPRAGFARDGVFFHPDLAFQFPVPSGYQVINQANQVVLVASDQSSAIKFSLESGVTTARAAAERFAAQQGLTVVQSGIGSANGMPAHYVVVDAADQSGNVTRARAQYIEYSGTIYSFLGLAAQANYAQKEPEFLRTMQGFNALRDASILSIQPHRVNLRTPQSATPFNALVGNPPAGFTLEELAIMNQVNLTSVISAGTSVKVVR